MAEWSFLTNHSRVLVCIAHDPGMRLRDIATTVGITERTAFGIVNDLIAAGYVVRTRRVAATATPSRPSCPSEKSSVENGRSVRCWNCSWTPRTEPRTRG